MKSATKKEINSTAEEVTPNVTPMMQQYLEVKKNHQDCLLFYRMGDFYELFFEDAVTAAAELELVLTRRGEHQGKEIPMCGVPHHAHENYLNKLIKKGYKVAICEQAETPEEAKKKRGYKAVVQRNVIRIVTPGTITEDNLLEGFSANYLIGLSKSANKYLLAACDISTGEFFINSHEKEKIISEIEKLNPKEILLSDQIFTDRNFDEVFSRYKKIITTQSKSLFTGKRGEEKIRDFYNITAIEHLKLNHDELGLCGALLDYVQSTQISSKPNINFPKKNEFNDFMDIDFSTQASLEIFRSSDGSTKNSLFGNINKTRTSSGARFLQKALTKPLINSLEIDARLDSVEFFFKNNELTDQVRKELKNIPDIERIISRIHLNRSTPRDLEGLKYGIKSSLNLNFIFSNIDAKILPNNIRKHLNISDKIQEILFLLDEAITNGAPALLSEGGYIKEGYNPKLDDYRKTKDNSVNILNALVEKYRSETGINTLKIKHNNILGFFLEVTPTNADKAPNYFIHRQTLAGNVRYTTQELREVENKIVNSQSYALALELEIFREICEKIKNSSNEILLLAKFIAEIDFYSSLAVVADENNLTRPTIDNSTIFELHDARHLIVENNLKNKNSFTANNINLNDENKVWLITGPNMSGKSTFLRQNAIIGILAQIGSFVPARSAKIGIIDKLFSRVGASDNLAKGQSTFMVEMSETATILNNATERSLVILDEIGRGTSTYDGISIAWAVLEYIHNKINCRTLFATHYHELTSLNKKLPKISLHTTEIKEWNDEIIFSHKIIEGAAGKSYGINVAKLAGVPNKVTARAEQILKILEEKNQDNPLKIFNDDLPLFATSNSNTSKNIYNEEFSDNKNLEEVNSRQYLSSPQNSNKNNKIISELTYLNLEEISPKQALDILYSLKNKVNQ